MSSGTGFGITDQGFVSPQLTDIQTQIDNSIRALFGNASNTAITSFFKQLSGIFAERELKVWQAGQDVYGSQIPASAFGASLDGVGVLRGIPRLNALPSTISNVRLFGTAGTLIPGATTKFSVNGNSLSIFHLNSDVTLVAGQSCVQTLTFSAVPVSGTYQLSLGGSESALINWNDSLSTVQGKIQALKFASGCIVTQLSATVLQIAFNGAGTGGFMVQSRFTVVEDALLDSLSAPITVTPAITTAGIDQANVNVTADANGPTVANAGTLTVISTPISGLTGVLNTQDAILGQLVETDNAYRARMDEELQIAGAGTVEAIRSRLLQITGVTTALVFENTTMIPDLQGRPPKSFEAVIEGGDAATIAETIWLAKPAGIQSFGNNSTTIIDSQGQVHTINYSRPTAVPVYIVANLVVDANYPVNGDTLVAQTLATYGNTLGIGVELIVSPKLIASLISIPGIQDVELLVGTAPGPTLPNNITPAIYEILEFDTSRITVVR